MAPCGEGCDEGPVACDTPDGYTREKVSMFVDPAGDRATLVVRSARRAAGETLDAFVDRLLVGAREMKDFALPESTPMQVAGRPARKIRVRSKTDGGVLAQTVVFVDGPEDEVVSFACATTRPTEATREAVTRAQWAILEEVLTSARFG